MRIETIARKARGLRGRWAALIAFAFAILATPSLALAQAPAPAEPSACPSVALATGATTLDRGLWRREVRPFGERGPARSQALSGRSLEAVLGLAQTVDGACRSSDRQVVLSAAMALVEHHRAIRSAPPLVPLERARALLGAQRDDCATVQACVLDARIALLLAETDSRADVEAEARDQLSCGETVFRTCAGRLARRALSISSRDGPELATAEAWMVLAELEPSSRHPGELNPDHVLQANEVLRAISRYASPLEDGARILPDEFRRVQLPIFQAVADAVYATRSEDEDGLISALLELGEMSRTAQIESTLADACERLEVPMAHSDLNDTETIIYPVVGAARTYILVGRREGWRIVLGGEDSGADALGGAADRLLARLPEAAMEAATGEGENNPIKPPWAQDEAHRLFAGLIAPLTVGSDGAEPILVLYDAGSDSVPTLIIFPDPAIRNVPWALLSPAANPENYLLKSAALVVQPGLAYVPPPTPSRRGRWLLAGFDASAGDDPTEQGAEGLVQYILDVKDRWGMPDGSVIKGRAFTGEGLRQALRSGEFDAVMIASHARFRPGGSQIRIYEPGAERWLDIHEIEGWLQTARRRARNLELLFLVACEGTTGGAGDLGIAGAALRAGATTTIGSLTEVPASRAPQYFDRDERLEPSFLNLYAYRGLSPAHALRQSQLSSPEGLDYPPFWGVLVLVGGWR